MRRITRILPFILCLALCLAACGGDKTPAQTPTPEATTSPEPTPEPPRALVVYFSRAGEMPETGVIEKGITFSMGFIQASASSMPIPKRSQPIEARGYMNLERKRGLTSSETRAPTPNVTKIIKVPVSMLQNLPKSFFRDMKAFTRAKAINNRARK